MSRKRRVTAGEQKRGSERQIADLAAFRRMLQISSGTFSLSFAVCDDRKLRDSLVERFCAEVPGIAIIRLPAGVDGIYTATAAQIGSQTPSAIFVLDIEASVPFGSDSQPALRTLNGSRELWEAFRCPVIFWLAEYAITLLHRHAPDFWRYRSHQFEFIPEAVPLTDLKTESFSGFEMVDALPISDKAFRVTELERRLREAGDPPSADLLPHVVTWAYELAHLYQHASRYAEAKTLLRKALEWNETKFGVDHPQTATALNNLAQLLQATNRLAEAEPLMRRALAINESRFGRNHPSVAICLNNLALLFKATARLEEAEEFMQRALVIDEARYGKDHPQVATDLNNLAALLQSTNRLREAETLMRRALAIDETCFGESHPNVAICLNNLAEVLRDTNRLVEAEALMQRALRIFESSYGPNHHAVATILNNLAQLLQDTNRLDEAEKLMRRALGVFESSYGPSHLKVVIRLANLAELLICMNQLDEAETLMRRVLGIHEDCYGPHHIQVARDLKNLAVLLQTANRLAEAESLWCRALGIFARSSGISDPESQDAGRHYMDLLKALNVPEEEIVERVKGAVEGG